MEISVEILSTRIENDANLKTLVGVDVVTARALAPLQRLLALVAPFAVDKTTCIFMKGREAGREIDEARENWSFEAVEQASITDPEAKIVVVRHIVANSNSATTANSAKLE